MMNKLKRVVSAVITASIGAVSIGFSVHANPDPDIESKGNIVFEDGEMALYTSDIDYLQNELNALFNEIPDEDKVSPTLGAFDYIRKENIQSKGIIDYAGGTVVINSSDFIYMANEIDELENTYKQIILKYLNGINTYMTADGSVTHDVVDSDVTYFPSFGDLINGISLSQEVETGTTIDNLSKDKGAWVNGEYITGNGNDVNLAYSQGYIDGVNYTVENANISYVYHEHTGEQSGAGTGCYQGYHICNNNCTTTETCSGSVSWSGDRVVDLGYGEIAHMATAKCSGCGATWEFCSYVENPSSHGGSQLPSNPYTHANWPNGTWTVYTPYHTSGTINAYRLKCGKTEGVTIESATITFDE